jgi:hypothetical protein
LFLPSSVPGFYNLSSPGSATPRFGSSQPDEQPPVSSSPGPYEQSTWSNLTSPARDASIGSESASSASTFEIAHDSVIGDGAQSFHGAQFASSLSERLLYVANQAEGQHSQPKIWRTVSEGGIHPVQLTVEGYRLIKRAPSGQAADDPKGTPRKVRKMDQEAMQRVRQSRTHSPESCGSHSLDPSG